MTYKKGTYIGPFRLEGLLNEGGMASVYGARVIDRHNRRRDGNRIALKIAKNTGQNSAIFEELLLKETELLRRLRHPGIVRHCQIPSPGRLLDYARAPHLVEDPNNAPWYFAMELLDGGTVLDILTKKQNSLEWRVELIFQIALVIHYIHQMKFAHRDLKPENIMFRSPPEPHQIPVPVLIDFGLAEKRAIEPEVQAASLSHAPPERVEYLLTYEGYRRTAPEARHEPSDIWALGIIAYQLLSFGQYPFGDTTRRTSLAQRITRDAPIPLNNHVPARLGRLITEFMLHKQQNQRPTIREIINTLEGGIEILAPRI